MSGRVFSTEKQSAIHAGKRWAKGSAERLRLINQFDENVYPFYNYFDSRAWDDFRSSYGVVAVLAPLVSFMDWVFNMSLEDRMRSIGGEMFFVYRLLHNTLKMTLAERLEYFTIRTESGLTAYLDDLGYEPVELDRKVFQEWRNGLGRIVKDEYPQWHGENGLLAASEAYDEKFY